MKLQWASITIGAVILAIIGFATVRGDDPHNSLFGTYWSSGRAALHGQNPYALYPETYRSGLTWCGGPKSAPDLNLNPPTTLPIFALLARVPRSIYGEVWTALSVLTFLAGAMLLLCNLPGLHPYKLLWLLAMTPTLNTVSAGQLYGILFLLAAVGCALALRGHLRTAGIALGILIAVKPTMIFFLPFLLLAGYGQAALYAGLAFASTWATIPFFYAHSYPQWLAALHGDMHWIVPTDIAPIAVARRHGVEWLGIAIAVAIFVALAAWIWKKRPSFLYTCGLAACAGLLCAPLAWHNYIVVAAPFFIVRRWNRAETIAAALLILPTALAGVVGSTLYLIVILIVAASFIRPGLRTPSSSWDRHSEMALRS